MILKKLSKNAAGTDYVVGDIHGCFSALEKELHAIGFSFTRDRLFSVGDLVDRGSENEKALDWLECDWFHPVRGNHDDYVVRYKTVDLDNWGYNGGLWFQSLLDHEKQEFSDAFSCIPLAIQVETDNGLVGIVHANPSVSDWSEIESFARKNRENKSALMWDRSRIESMDTSVVAGVSVVVCGHTPLDNPLCLGNVWHIDTAGWHKSGRFTIAKLEDLASY